MKTVHDTSMCTKCGYLLNAPDAEGDQFLNRVFGLALLLSVIGLLFLAALSVDAQVDDAPVCEGLPTWMVGEDLTAELMESYRRDLSPERRAQLREVLHVDFAYSPFNGFYNWNGLPSRYYKEKGTWVVLNKLEDGRYRIWAGTDWTIGDDDQLHYGNDNRAACMLYVSSGYEWYFAQYPRLWYPTGELYWNH